jgi:hypothetical protein
MITRATAIGAALAVLVTGGLATAAVAHSHSSAADAGWNPVPGAVPATSQSVAKKPGGGEPRPVDKVPALTVAQVQYVHRSWGDAKTKVAIDLSAPKGWKQVKLTPLEVKFTSANTRWNLRVNASSLAETPKVAADHQFELTSASVEDFKLISRTTGSTRATNPNYQGMVFYDNTLTYTYTDPKRGPRLVVDRFVGLQGNNDTLFELSGGGRPQDAAALAAITTKVIESFSRLP